jgi:hypothetical protein
MTANAVDFGSAALSAFMRAAGLVVLAIGAAFAFIFAFAAALIVGLMVTGAAVAMRLWPRQRKPASTGPEILEARCTPAGWVVETLGRRKS